MTAFSTDHVKPQQINNHVNLEWYTYKAGKPFRPILFLSIDSFASGGIIHLPPGPWMAVTFLSSHWIGA